MCAVVRGARVVCVQSEHGLSKRKLFRAPRPRVATAMSEEEEAAPLFKKPKNRANVRKRALDEEDASGEAAGARYAPDRFPRPRRASELAIASCAS